MSDDSGPLPDAYVLGAWLPSAASAAALHAPVKDIFSEFEAYTRPNWDGDDAEPIAPETIRAARALYDALHRELPFPSIAPGADGTIAFQWQLGSRDEPHFVIIEAGPGPTLQGRIVTAAGEALRYPPVSPSNADGVTNLISRLFVQLF